MNRRAMTHAFRAIAALVLPLVLTASLAACGGSPSQTAERPPLEGARIGGPFTLVDKTGKTVRWDDFKGKYRIVYFGYTFCPDACPTDMQRIAAGLARFEKAQPQRAAQVQPIFITIDPARDTPQVVGEFAAAFSPRIIGLTGTTDQVAQAAKAFSVYYAKGKESTGGYLMDHQQTAFLMGRNGEPIALLPIDLAGESGAQAIAADLDKWVK